MREDIRKSVGSDKNAVDLVIGGPPCQPFSKSAYWARGDTRRLKVPRANTLDEYFRIVEEFAPKAFLLENVHWIGYSGKEEGFQFLIRRIREINRKKGTDYRRRPSRSIYILRNVPRSFCACSEKRLHDQVVSGNPWKPLSIGSWNGKRPMPNPSAWQRRNDRKGRNGGVPVSVPLRVKVKKRLAAPVP